jgi:ankyrin repeat protein
MNTTTITPTSISTQIQSALSRISSLPSFQQGLQHGQQEGSYSSPLSLLVSPDANGYTPLHYAAASDDLPLSTQLLFIFQCFGRPDLFTPLDKHGRTPLHWAVDSASVRIVHLLIESGVPVNTQDYDGTTALHHLILALQKNPKKEKTYREILEYLVPIVEVNGSDINGVSALHLAAEFGDLESMRLLIQNGAIVNITDHQGENPLFYAVRAGHYKIIRALVEEFNINIDMMNEDEENVLDLCMAIGEQNLIDFVKILYNGRVIHQKMRNYFNNQSQTGMKCSNTEIIENNSGYIRISGHSCA